MIAADTSTECREIAPVGGVGALGRRRSGFFCRPAGLSAQLIERGAGLGFEDSQWGGAGVEVVEGAGLSGDNARAERVYDLKGCATSSSTGPTRGISANTPTAAVPKTAGGWNPGTGRVVCARGMPFSDVRASFHGCFSV